MPYPFSWKPNFIFVTTPSQVTVFDSNGSTAIFDVGIAVSINGTITFSLANPGTYLVKVRASLELETAKFNTVPSGTATALYTSYEKINQDGIRSLDNLVTLAELSDPTSNARFVLDTIITGSDSVLPSGGSTGDVIRRAANGLSEWFTLTKSAVGLGNVDNTSDSSKPVSTAQQTALNAKANLASPTFTGTVGGITKSMVGLGSVDNTADADKPVSTAQQTALNAKANLASPTFTGTVAGITKSMVGLGSVDNTADTAKPVSTAQNNALNLRRNIAQAVTTRTTTPYSIGTGDEIIIANMATAITFSLPDPGTSGITGRIYIIKNIGAGTLTVNSIGTSKTLDGATSQTLAQYAKAQYVSNGTQWFTV